MKKIILVLLLLGFGASLFAQTLKSPDGTLKFSFTLTQAGEPVYQLSYKNKAVVKPSKLGIDIKNQTPMLNGFRITRTDSTTVNETWEPIWGEVKQIKNNYRELAVTLTQPSANNRTLIIRFRLFNDGLGFRYEFPKQPNLQHFIVKDELTQFVMTGDHKTFWIPGDFDTNEYTYSTTPLTGADASARKNSADEIATRNQVTGAVQTPLMMKSADGLYINIHEAALINYPAMILMIDKSSLILTSTLAPDGVGNKAYLQTPSHTPWRTILVSDKATDLLASKTILNLNEPSKIKDTDWIKPTKFIGIWWEMHVGVGTWFYSDDVNLILDSTDWKSLKPNGRHSANTANTKKYIDFAAKHGFDGVLIEGWNVGWEDWFGQWKENVFDFTTPYPDFDVQELHRYAASKNVKLIMHHETSGSVTNYERRLDDAYAFMKENGYDAVKTGYVGKIIPRGEWHDGQWMVNHYIRVAGKAAEYKIMIDAHEPVRSTGLHRTYPNWLASEAARGNEFNAWSIGSPPEHETILPFTRLMGGPMDYTPGIFQIKMDYYVSRRPLNNQTPNGFAIHTTLAKQLALYVTMYSPFQMAADLPENYDRFPDAFQFIKDVAVDWDDTKILEAEPGDYVTIARKAKGKEEWFIGSITDEQKRNAVMPLTFLKSGQKYVATLYSDKADADWDKNPMAYQVENMIVDSKTTLKLAVAAGGGAAISLKPATADDLKKWKPYKAKK